MKKLNWVLPLALLMSVPSLASDVSLELGSAAVALPECGGTISASASSNDKGGPEKVKLTLRQVQSCSSVKVEKTGETLKLHGPSQNRDGDFEISAGQLNAGWNQIRLTVSSNSFLYSDVVTIWINL